jgi:hypothetical protein
MLLDEPRSGESKHENVHVIREKEMIGSFPVEPGIDIEYGVVSQPW